MILRGWPRFPCPKATSWFSSFLSERALPLMNSRYENLRSLWVCLRSRSSKHESGRNSLADGYQDGFDRSVGGRGTQTEGRTGFRANRRKALGPMMSYGMTMRIRAILTDTCSIIWTISRLCCCFKASCSGADTVGLTSTSFWDLCWTVVAGDLEAALRVSIVCIWRAAPGPVNLMRTMAALDGAGSYAAGGRCMELV